MKTVGKRGARAQFPPKLQSRSQCLRFFWSRGRVTLKTVKSQSEKLQCFVLLCTLFIRRVCIEYLVIVIDLVYRLVI